MRIKIVRDLALRDTETYQEPLIVRGVPAAEIEDYIETRALSSGLLRLCRKNIWGKPIAPDSDLESRQSTIYGYVSIIEEYEIRKQRNIDELNHQQAQWRSYNKETSEPFQPWGGRLEGGGWTQFEVGEDFSEFYRSFFSGEPSRAYARNTLNTPDGFWVYRGKIVNVSGAKLAGITMPEVILRLKHLVLKQEKALTRIEKEVDAFQNMAATEAARREPIPEAVRLFVWQRDGGKCVKCGSNELLEFDHIIPIAKGGSSTERNVQLLCEKCNRSKSTNL